MLPFSSIPPNEYKPENFFPCITKEYRDDVRKSFELRDPNNIDLDEELYSDLDSKYVGWTIPKEPSDDERPEYVTNIFGFQNIIKGGSLDVTRLLRLCRYKGLIRCVPNTSDRDDVASDFRFVKVRFEKAFKDKKYVMFFCAFAPSKWSEENATYLCRLSLLSSELLRCERDDFEMVMVAKMRKNENRAYDDKKAFHTLFSAFPGRLAVPYSNKIARDYVCSELNFNGKVNVVLVGPAPEYEILQCGSSFLLTYGASAFPFTDHALQTISQKPSRFSLLNILSCDPSLRLSTFGSHQTKSESVQNLSKKLVGLYLFQVGNRFRKFYDVYNQCKQQGFPFEIVLVCMPGSSASVHPDIYQEEIHKLLGSSSIDISSWWVFPYDNSACLRIEQMFVDEISVGLDQMIIVGPRGKFADARGGDVIDCFGIKAYPFDREHLVKKYLNRVNEVTLESLLCHGTKDYVVRHGRKYDMEYFKDRNVFLYMDKAPLCLYTFGKLCSWYDNIEEYDPNFKLVFICLENNEQFWSGACCLPWLICEYDPDHVARLRNHNAFFAGVELGSFIEGLRPPLVIAFGKDGCIQVLDAIYLERKYGHKVNPFRPELKDLRRDVIRRMSDLDFMRDYGDY